MAVGLLAHEVSDLCIGKPPLRPLPLSATVGEALLSLKRCGESCLSVWAESSPSSPPSCVGKVCMVDVICYLCAEENLASPSSALSSPVSILLTEDSAGLVKHVERHASVVEALDAILGGAQSLVVPLRGGGAAAAARKKSHPDSLGLCWLTQEDFIRFFFNSIGVFSPIPALSVDSLGIVRRDPLAVRYNEPALSTVPLIRKALACQTAVAVVTGDGKLIGEISPSALASCDESVAAAVATLSAGELMGYLDCGDPPEEVLGAVKARLRERGMAGMLELVEEEGEVVLSDASLSSLSSGSSSGSSSSDEEPAATGRTRRKRSGRAGRYPARAGRRSSEGAVVCQRGSSLMAVMMQALAHRVSYVWVVEEDYELAGVVTFSDVLKVFRELLQ